MLSGKQFSQAISLPTATNYTVVWCVFFKSNLKK